jgi:hypothetical protein
LAEPGLTLEEEEEEDEEEDVDITVDFVAKDPLGICK